MFYKASKIEISELATYTEVKPTCFFAPRRTKLLCFGIVFIHANEFLQYLKVTTDFAKQTISPLLPSALEDANVWWGVGTVSVSLSLTVPFQQFPNARLHFKPSLFLSVSESCPPLAWWPLRQAPSCCPTRCHHLRFNSFCSKFNGKASMPFQNDLGCYNQWTASGG